MLMLLLLLLLFMLNPGRGTCMPAFGLIFGAFTPSGRGGGGDEVTLVGVRRMFSRQVGQVCWRWNHDRRHVVWNI